MGPDAADQMPVGRLHIALLVGAAVTFKGSITTEEERKKLPPEVRARVGKIETIHVGSEAGQDFDQEGAAIGQPHKTRMVREIVGHAAPPAPSF